MNKTVASALTVVPVIAMAFAVMLPWPTAQASSADRPDLILAVPPYPAGEVKAKIADVVLGHLGYSVKRISLQSSVAMASIQKGDVDANLSVWMPQQTEQVNSLEDSGTGSVVAVNVPDALIALAVPLYVWKAGVHSVKDLANHAEQFDKKIYGYGAGTGTNKIVLDALQHDVANLGSWHLVQSSTSGMLLAVKHAIPKHQWIAFLGWKPHWMNIVFNFKYLNDSGLIFTKSGGGGKIVTVANSRYMQTHPNVGRFLRQYTIDASIQDQWVYQFTYKEKPLDGVVNRWIDTHPKVIRGWVDSVKAANGKEATVMLHKKGVLGLEH